MKFYGLDWAAMIFSLAALYFLGKKDRTGFVFFAAANLCLIFVGCLAPSVAIIAGNLLYAVINLRSFAKWKPTASVGRAREKFELNSLSVPIAFREFLKWVRICLPIAFNLQVRNLGHKQQNN